MARKPKVTGQVMAPDFDKAKSIWDNDIRPARRTQKQAMRDQADAWKAAKGEAFINKPAFAQAAKLHEMEEADQQSWFRTFFGACDVFSIGLYADMADKAEGVKTTEDGFVVPPTVKASTIEAPILN